MANPRKKKALFTLLQKFGDSPKMSRIKEIQFFVENVSVEDFNTVLKSESIEVGSVMTFSPTSFEKFLILAENIIPKARAVIGALQKLVSLHKKEVHIDIQTKDGSWLKADVKANNAEDVLRLLDKAENMYIRVTERDRS
ncbi:MULTISPECIES: hypothetical protein [Serratia]|uniref:hypothetical protein n=1 Tax=Serratia TaxID=613 RepID=UPI0019336F27|nr:MULTISPECIES: hypothetical protein [Serratia]WBF43742.1 hypothetical protein OLD77_13845 [Serratia rubidaea]CAE1145042.1 protein of unknown function [Serratia sp. Tan611]